MKLGTMLGDAIASLFSKPNTRLYPFDRQEAPARYRGQLIWNQATCTACGLCAMDCPAEAIEMLVIDKKTRQFVFRYHEDRCTFCAQCVHSCNKGSLSLSNVWEMAALGKEGFIIDSGSEEDIAEVLKPKPAIT